MPVLMISAGVMAVILALSVVTDIRSRRIPNNHVLTGLMLAVVMHAVAKFAGQDPLAGMSWYAPLAGLLAGGGLLLIFYLLGACGAGDVKLMAMVGAFVGVQTAVAAVLFTFAAGGVLSMIYMVHHRAFEATSNNLRFLLVDWLVRLRTSQGVRLASFQKTSVRLPYAVAIATGTMGALWLRFASA